MPMFLDILTKIFISAKRKNMSQTIFTTFTTIDELDGRPEGFVKTTDFVEALIKLLGEDLLSRIELEYLSMKYRQMDNENEEERDQVYYEYFYKDFLHMDENGLTEMINGI